MTNEELFEAARLYREVTREVSDLDKLSRRISRETMGAINYARHYNPYLLPWRDHPSVAARQKIIDYQLQKVKKIEEEAKAKGLDLHGEVERFYKVLGICKTESENYEAAKEAIDKKMKQF